MTTLMVTVEVNEESVDHVSAFLKETFDEANIKIEVWRLDPVQDAKAKKDPWRK